jgi:hypothetical protein
MLSESTWPNRSISIKVRQNKIRNKKSGHCKMKRSLDQLLLSNFKGFQVHVFKTLDIFVFKTKIDKKHKHRGWKQQKTGTSNALQKQHDFQILSYYCL